MSSIPTRRPTSAPKPSKAPPTPSGPARRRVPTWLRARLGHANAWLGRTLTGPAPWYARAGAMVGVAALLLLALLLAGQALLAGVSPRAMEQHRSDSSTVDLDAPLIAQSFRSDRGNLSTIELQLGSFNSLPREGEVRLVAGDGRGGKAIYQAPLSTARFVRNAYLDIDLSGVATSPGTTYTLVLTSPQPLRAYFGLRYSAIDQLSSGQMYTDAGRQPGDLAFSVHYAYGLLDLLGDIGSSAINNVWLVLCWLLALLAPGLALLVWLPNSLSAGQRLLAAPGVSALAYPVLFLLLRQLGLRVGTVALWVLLLFCLLAIGAWWYVRRPTLRLRAVRLADVAFWALFAAVLVITLGSRLLPLRDLMGGMGLDAYHHTLIARMFIDAGGIPSSYEPYAPLASFTYHFGFHSLVAVVAWLSGLTSGQDLTGLMPQVGQIATALPVVTLTLFGWKCLGDRWAGLAAGALAGLVSVFPAFYVNWSRYTQGLGLALLPVAWVLLLEAADRPQPTNALQGRPGTRMGGWSRAINSSAPYMLAVIGAAGLMLTHYRIIIIYAVVVLFYVLWRLAANIRLRKPAAEVAEPAWRALVVAVLAAAALLPWLINLRQNFTANFLGRNTGVIRNYYDLNQTIGPDLLNHWGLPVMLVLALGGLGWALRRRDPLPLLPALAWVVLGIWSNPYLLGDVRLPFAGYLDVTTLVSGAWLPAAILAGYPLARVAAWVVSLAEPLGERLRRGWTYLSAGLIGAAVVVAGLAAALALGVMVDSKPYIERADLDAMAWMRSNLPRDSYVLANPFAFPWDADPKPVHGSDSGLWIPLLTEGIRSSVPPIPAYNERLADPNYLNNIREVVGYEPFKDRTADWSKLKQMGITNIYAGSRGGAMDVAGLLTDSHVTLSFHEDGVYLFRLK